MGRVFRRGKTWTWRAEFGRDPVTQKRIQRTKGGYRTKAEAQKALAEAEHEHATGTSLEPHRLTVADYLRRWLTDHAALRVTPKTLESYRDECEKHLIPNLGAIRLPELKPLHITRYYAHAVTNGRLDGKGGLSPTTVRYHHRLLHEALEQAVRWQLLHRNPADAVTPPPAPHRDEPDLEETSVLQLLKAAEGTWLYIPVLLAISTGMRRGEIAALRWSDIEWGRGVLTVNQSLEETAEGLRFKGPKSRKPRQIKLSDSVVIALRQWKGEQAQQQLATAGRTGKAELVLCHPTGEPYLPGSITHAWIRLRNRLGVELRFHDLRHFQGTFLASRNVHIAVIQARLGHADMNTTRRYVHVDETMQDPATQHVDELLKGWIPGEEGGAEAG